MGVLNLVPFCSIWGNDELRVGEKERFISNMISKNIEFKKVGTLNNNLYSKVMVPYVKYWENIFEMLSRPIPRVILCWKAFCNLAIGELIMSTHPFVPLLMLTLKIMSSLHTVGLKTCTLLWALQYTHLFVTCLLIILFFCSLQTL